MAGGSVEHKMYPRADGPDNHPADVGKWDADNVGPVHTGDEITWCNGTLTLRRTVMHERNDSHPSVSGHPFDKDKADAPLALLMIEATRVVANGVMMSMVLRRRGRDATNMNVVSVVNVVAVVDMIAVMKMIPVAHHRLNHAQSG